MELTSEQQQKVAEWVRSGEGPAQVQRHLDEEFGIKMTFMDVRFLIDDLDLDLQNPPEPAAAADPNQVSADADATLVDSGPGGVSVSVDAVQRPGAMLSGSATMGDGETLQWQIDQMGRLGLVPPREGYQPSEADLMAFQQELQTVLAQKGFA